MKKQYQYKFMQQLLGMEKQYQHKLMQQLLVQEEEYKTQVYATAIGPGRGI